MSQKVVRRSSVYFSVLLAISCSFLSIQLAFAASLEQLVKSASRPTMLEVAEAMHWDFSKNPFYQSQYSSEYHLSLMRSSGPELIAQFEHAFPGAVWAPLGRDAVIVGDFLDGFYLSQGQRDRVVRLNASTASFSSAVPIIEYYQSLGLVDRAGNPTKKFVILDRTSYGAYSQSRRIISAVYAAISGDRTKYLSEVGMIALGSGHTQITPELDMAGFHRGNSVDGAPSPTYILGTWIALTDSSAWHETFGPFQRSWGGQVTTAPGPIADEGTRRYILGQMIEIFRIVQTAEFRTSLQAQASRYHVSLIFDQLMGHSIADWIPLMQATPVKEKTFKKWLEGPSNSKSGSQVSLSSVQAFELKLLMALLGDLSKDQKENFASQLKADGEKLTSNDIETLKKDFYGLPDPLVASFIVKKGPELAEILGTAMDSGGSRLDSVMDLLFYLSPKRFEKALSKVKDDYSLKMLLKSLVHPRPEHTRAIERSSIHIAIVAQDKGTLSTVFQQLSPASQRGFVSQLLNSAPSVQNTLDVLQGFPLPKADQEKVVADHLPVFLNQVPSTANLNALSSYLSSGPARDQVLSTLVERALSSNDPKELRQALNSMTSTDSILLSGYADRLMKDNGSLDLLSSDVSLMVQVCKLLPLKQRPEFFSSLLSRAADLESRANLVEKILPILDIPHPAKVKEGISALFPGLSAKIKSAVFKTDPIYLQEAISGASDKKQLLEVLTVSGPLSLQDFEKNRKNILQYHNDPEVMAYLYPSLPTWKGGDEIARAILAQSRSTGEMLSHLKAISSQGFPVENLISLELKTFFSFKPTVWEINQLIGIVSQNGWGHSEIAVQTLQTIQTLSEYGLLIHPRRPYTPAYKAAQKAFKKAHPSESGFCKWLGTCSQSP